MDPTRDGFARIKRPVSERWLEEKGPGSDRGPCDAGSKKSTAVRREAKEFHGC